MLVSKVKPCTCEYECVNIETANGSLKELLCSWHSLVYGYPWELQSYYMITCSLQADGQWLSDWKPLTCCARGSPEELHFSYLVLHYLD